MAPCENISTPTGDKTNFLQENKSTGYFFDDELTLGNCSLWNKGGVNCSLEVTLDEVPVKLNKFQIIKAVVLAGVTIVIMISICRMVFQLFVRYNVRQDR